MGQKAGAPGDNAPYQVQGAQVADSTPAVQLASTNQQITAATRGQAQYVVGTDYSKIAPTGCIGPDVYFNLPEAVVIAAAGDAASRKMVYSFCNPTGYSGVAESDNTVEENFELYTRAAGTAGSYAFLPPARLKQLKQLMPRSRRSARNKLLP